MPVKTRCDCGWSASVPDKYAGKRGKCPKCGAAVAIPALLADPGPAEVLAVSRPASRERVRVETIEPSPRPTPTDLKTGNGGTANVHVSIHNDRQGRHTNVTGIVAVVFGAIALAVCWIPFLGMVAIPLGALAAVLGIVGLIIALATRKSGIASPIVGASIGVAASIASFVITGATVSAFDQAMDEANQPEAVAVAAGVDGPAGAAAPGFEAVPVANPGAGVVPGPDAAASPSVVMAPEWAELGGVRARIQSARIGPAMMKDKYDGDQGMTESSYLIVSVEVMNPDPNRKLSYLTWGDTGFGLGNFSGRARDNFGNQYAKIDATIGQEIVGSTKSASIYPGDSVGDVLVFEPPIGRAEYIDLELPGSNVDAEGVFRFRLPMNFVEQ